MELCESISYVAVALRKQMSHSKTSLSGFVFIESDVRSCSRIIGS